MASDLERVARAIAKAKEHKFHSLDDLACAAMAETRRIDAEALRDATKYRSKEREKWADWLEQRANAPQQ